MRDPSSPDMEGIWVTADVALQTPRSLTETWLKLSSGMGYLLLSIASPHPSCLYPCQNTHFKRVEEVNKALPKHKLCSACPQ